MTDSSTREIALRVIAFLEEKGLATKNEAEYLLHGQQPIIVRPTEPCTCQYCVTCGDGSCSMADDDIMALVEGGLKPSSFEFVPHHED